MVPNRNEQTLARPCEVVGRGYWSGQQVRLRLLPAPTGTGVILCRSDLPRKPGCAAISEHAVDASFRTNLRNGSARFAMVEHLLAALSGLRIDNCRVECDAEELPGLDGSSLAYAEAILAAGHTTQSAPRRTLEITAPLRVQQGESWIEATPLTPNVGPDHTGGYFEYRLEYERCDAIPAQTFGVALTPQRFRDDVAPARTFVTADQADALRAQGVARHVTNQDLIVLGPDGPIENALRFEDEFARHKTLDLIGDLALSGVDLVGNFVSYRGGHILNGRMASELFRLAGERDASPESRARPVGTRTPLSAHPSVLSRPAPARRRGAA